MSLREEQCKKVCRILDDVLANRPTERDSLIVAVRKAFESLEQFGNSEPLPSAQPETHEERTETNACDCISRQAAIDEIVTWLKDRMTDGKNGKPLTDRIKDLTSAQPESTMDQLNENGQSTKDCISRQGAIRLITGYNGVVDKSVAKRLIAQMPSAEKPFKLPEIYVAEGFDTVEGEDGNIGFGVYVPDENQIYIAGDVEDEIRARALLHEVCHWVQAMCGRSFDEDEANEFSDIVYDALPSAQPEPHWIPCSERLPEKDGYYLTSTMYRQVYRDYWNGDNFDRTEMVIAWQSLPEPYEPDEQYGQFDRHMNPPED